MTLEELKAAFPDLHAAIYKSGQDAGFATGIEQGRKEGQAEGASAERTRILAIEATALPGHDKLIAQLKADGVTTAPEAAVRILAAEKADRETKLAAFEKDTGTVVATVDSAKVEAAAAAAVAVKGEDDTLPIEERAKATWDKDPAVRAEFGGDFDVYVAFRKADAGGQVKIYNGHRE